MGNFKTISTEPDAIRVADIVIDGVIVGRLFARLPTGPSGWTQVKLELLRRRPKKSYWAMWNGTRISRVRDARLLALHDPAIHAEVVRILAERFPPTVADDGHSPAPGEPGYRQVVVRLDELAERVARLEAFIATVRP